MNRRNFIKKMLAGSAITGSALSGVPFMPNVQLANAAAFSGKTLVVIFQRGGCDGLNTVVPFGDDEYYRLRPTISIPSPFSGQSGAALNLDSFFGLHPALSPLYNIHQKGDLAVLPAVHYPNATHSHFSGQDFIESGATRRLNSGWLNRHLSSSPQDSAIRAVSFGNELVHSLRGSADALSFNNLSDFTIGEGSDDILASLQGIYQQTAESDLNRSLIYKNGLLMLDNMKTIEALSAIEYTPANGVTYPGSGYGRQLQQVAQLIKSEVGLEVATVSIGGWDTHSGQGGAVGRQANSHARFASGIEALYNDLGSKMNDVVILTMTEFGRTAKENASAGTDHGDASSWFVIGGNVNNGVYGAWPGLQKSQLVRGRNLSHSVEFLDVFAEVMTRHLHETNLSTVLPGHNYSPIGFLS